MTVRIAMWSGPRTISTAMLRAWGARSDCTVVDEPLYAAYLAATDLDHPGRADILAAQPTDPDVVLAELSTAPTPRPLQYQKHMAHHLLPGMDRTPLTEVRHAFLIRDPAEVIASYAQVRTAPTMDDLGLEQQVELFERYGGPVVDSNEVLQDPPRMLGLLCAALDVPYDAAMLSWPSGPQPTDGVWGPHWYAAVWSSTGFAPHRRRATVVPEHLTEVLAQCRPFYAALAAHRLR